MTATRPPEIVPLLLAEFQFPDLEPAGRVGVVVGYAVRHERGILLFDTGFGFGNAELGAAYHPVARPIGEVLAEAGIALTDITEIVNCHLYADHAGQNAAFPSVPIYVQPVEWELAQTTDHTILEWVDFEGARYERIAGDHEPAPDIRVIATPGHTPGHQSLVVAGADGPTVLGGQACYSVGEWRGDADALEGRTSATDQAAYDRSIERLRALRPTQVLFGHDRQRWTA